MGTTPTMENINKEPASTNINLLLSFLRYSLNTISYEELELASKQDIDWEIFNKLIQFHKVGALIHSCISDTNLDLLPADTLNLLKQIHTNNAAGNLLLSSKAIEIFRELKANQIPVLLVKGLAVEDWLYEKPGIRYSGDIDLLIKADDLTQALACMKSMGYKLVYLPDRLKPETRLFKQFINSQKDFVFEHSSTKVSVELHWRLASKQSAFPLGFDESWEARSDFNIREKSIESLPQDMHAVYLCYHGSKHYWQNLFWLYDVTKLMLKEETDWHAILSQAQKLKAEASLGLALILASRIFLAPVPEIITQQVDIIASGEELSDAIYYKILADAPDWPSPDAATLGSVRQNISWNSRIHPSKNHLLPEMSSYLFSPGINDWGSLNLPDFLTPLYRVWRPIRLILKSLSKLKI